MEFHTTGYGRQFFDGQLPRLIEALRAIAARPAPSPRFVALPGRPEVFVNPAHVTLVEPDGPYKGSEIRSKVWVVAHAGYGTTSFTSTATTAEVAAALDASTNRSE